MEFLMLVQLANGALKLGRATGLITTAVDRAARETNRGVASLLKHDLDAADFEFKRAASSDVVETRNQAFERGCAHLRSAAAQEALPPSVRGMCCATLAALAERAGITGKPECSSGTRWISIANRTRRMNTEDSAPCSLRKLLYVWASPWPGPSPPCQLRF